MTTKLKILTLALCCALDALPLAPALAADTPRDGVAALLLQAEFWHTRNRPELARESLLRAQSVYPDNEEVLYRLGLYAAASDEKTASEWLQRLRTTHPGSPRIASLEQALAGKHLDRAQLAEIRLQAGRGDTAKAVQGYRQLLANKPPPPDLAFEYYQTLAGQDDTWDEARRGLEQLLAAQPGDPQRRLALARALSYREDTRRQAIGMLAELAPQLPEARADWRQALLWLDAKSTDEPLYQRYATAHPNDTQVPERFAEALASKRVSPADSARQAGYEALKNGRNAAAIASFNQAVRLNAQDADAWGGLGIAQLRAQNYDGARGNLRKAIELAPKARGKWAEALSSAEFYLQLQTARRQRDAGQLEAAASLARQLSRGTGENARAAKLLLGDILLRQPRLAEAEQIYREVLTETPRDEAALAGLYASLQRQDQRQQADELLRSHPFLANRTLGDLQTTEALSLRDRAEALRKQGDTAGAARLFGEALNLAPQNPWIRLSYARFLDANKEPHQARQLVEPLGDGPVSNDALQAATLFAVDQQRWEDAAAYLRRLPDAQRNDPKLQALRQRVALQQRIAQARQALSVGDLARARQALRALHDNPPADLRSRGEAGLALAELGEPAWALDLVRDDLRNPEQGDPAAYLSHAAVLLKTGQMSEADALMRSLERRGNLSTDDRDALQQLRSGIVVAQADRLRNSGNLSGAYDTLMDSLDKSPRDESLLLAMGRVYDAGRMHREAAAVYDSVLAQSPGNPEAVRGAVNTALAANDTPRASQLIAKAGGNLDERTALLLSARVAEAQGENRRAIALLESARRKQLPAPSPAALPSGAPLVLARRNPFGTAATVANGNNRLLASAGAPWLNRAGMEATPADPLASEIENTLAHLREKTATRLQAGAQIRSRQGEKGLSQLNEIQAPLSLSMVPLDNARLSLNVTPVNLNAGTASSATATRFGSYALKDAAVNTNFAYFYAQSAIEATALQQAAQQKLGRALTLAERTALQQQARTAIAGTLRERALASGATTAAADQLYNSLLTSSAEASLAAYRPGAQNASGVGLGVSYGDDTLKVDAGTTPLGFPKTNLVGGVSWSPKVDENSKVTLGLERRAVTDSLLSYAGARDPVTGKLWGAVTRTGVNAQYAYDDGTAGFYIGGDHSLYKGSNVASNSSTTLGAGAYVRPVRDADRELQTGVSLTWMGYDKNQGGLTLGHGGYFSPENYIGLAFPIQYSRTADRWKMKLHAAPGYQSFTQASAPYFPTDSALQGSLEQLQGDSVALFQGLSGVTAPTIKSRYDATSKHGMALNGGANLEYSLGKRTTLGGAVSYDSFGDYSETSGQLYLKHSMEKLP